MFLKRLEIQGFKSFAKKTTLEFERGITAIVGPNGSGKSNAADCLRWVLGEQSPKIMRGKKSDDVIFAGSDKKVRAGFAEVFATFDNSDRKIQIDAPEVSIGRRVDRSGESEYLLNGARVRLLDIIDLVLKSNIGTSRYTVIGQGTIDQLILAGPSEIKHLLDEASGVKTYYIKRDKTLRRLEQTAQNLMRAEDLVREIEPRLKSLRRQAKRMEARSEIEQELKIYQRDFYGGRYGVLEVAIKNEKAKQASTESKQKVLEHKIVEVRGRLEKIGQQAGSNELAKLERDLAELRTKKHKLLESVSMVRGKLAGGKQVGDAKALESAKVDLERKIKELENLISTAQTQGQRAQQSITGTAELLRQVNGRLAELGKHIGGKGDSEAVKEAFKELDAAFVEFKSKTEESQDLGLIKESARSFFAVFEDFAKNAREVILDPEVAQGEIQKDFTNLLTQKDELSAQLQAAQVSVANYTTQVDLQEKQVEDLKAQLLQVEIDLKGTDGSSSSDYEKALRAQEEQLVKDISSLDASITKIENEFTEFQTQQRQALAGLSSDQKEMEELQNNYNQIRQEASSIAVELAKHETQMQILIQEIHSELGSNGLAEVSGAKLPLAPELEDKIHKLKVQLANIGGVDELTMQEYQETESRYDTLTTQVADLKKGMGDLREIIDELDEHIRVRFNEAFHAVNAKFEYYFRILFNGGRAYLSLVKEAEENPTEEEGADVEISKLRPEEKVVAKYEKGASNVSGVDIKATPPGKKLSNIQALSGGERALTSIALLCSLLTCFPSPFVVLDEVDAALDEANTIRFGQILGTLSNQTQFITITHNRETMAQAGTLYGVSMGDDGISQLLSIKFDQAKEYAKS